MNNWISFSPHIKEKCSANKIYLMFIIAALPVAFDGIIKYGFNALFLILTSILTAVLCELVVNLILYKKFELKEISSIYTGFLIGLVMPPLAPIYMALIASAFAIIFVKALSGGTGKNYVSEVAAGKILLALMFGASFYRFIDPADGLEVSTTLVDKAVSGVEFKLDYLDLLLGTSAGAIGESGLIYIFVGFIFLSVMKVIDFKLPLSYLASTFLLSFAFFGLTEAIVLTASVMFVATFVITDYASSPNGGIANVIYGLALGLITVLLFKFGAYRYAGFYAVLIGGLVYSAIKGSFLPTKKIIKL